MKNIFINTHSSICIDNDIYFDPFKISENKKNAKVIFLTHSHYDHLDLASIHCVFTSDTVIVAPSDCIDILHEEGFLDENLLEVGPNQKGEVYDIKFETFASYNINKTFHPKAKNWVGYTIIIEGERYTICGDTDATNELKNIKTDILFVPIGGTYTMDTFEASEVVNTICPKVVIPVHYGSIVGKISDGAKFKNLINTNITVKLLLN